MKLPTLVVYACVAIASAAPTQTQQPRAAFDASLFNNFAFNSQDLSYLSTINSLDFRAIQQLVTLNNLQASTFSGLFSNNVFDVNSILQLQQIQILIQLQQTGVLGRLDLSTFALAKVQLGIINGVGEIDLTQFIDVALIPQIQTVVQQQNGDVAIVKK